MSYRVSKQSSLLLLSLFFTSIVFFNGFKSHFSSDINLDDDFIANIYAFSFEIAGNEWQQPEVWVDKWFLEQDAPFKYRLLAKLPIYVGYQVGMFLGGDLLGSFYYSYLSCLLLFIFSYLFCAAKMVEVVLDQMAPQSTDRSYMLLLASLALLAPILFAFKFPVHGSPNDFLGYTLIALSIMALCKEQYWHFIVFTLLGALCRETNLIVLAPLMLLSSVTLRFKVFVALLSVLVLIAVRLILGGGYTPSSGAEHNFKYPLESVLFLFLVFGPFWVLGILGWYHAFKQRFELPPLVRSLLLSFVPSLIAVFFLVLFFARIREIRIEYILFFYMIPFSLWYLEQLKVRLTNVRAPYYFAAIAVTAIVVFRCYVWFLPENITHFKYLSNLMAHFYGGFGGGWVHIFLVYLATTVLLLMLMLFVCVERVLAFKQPHSGVSG